VPPPEFQVTAPAPPAPAIQSTQVAPPAVTEVRPAPAPAPAAAPVAKPTKITAGMVCTKMGKPEMPSVNWSGEALYKAVATVKAGRVTAVEITSLRGGVDRKAQRALVQAIEATLRDTYECPGDHVFEQEFQFKIE
jgi:protein TonB